MAQREERERQRVERKREREWRKLVVVDDLPVRTNAQWAGMMVSPTLLSMLSEGGLAQSAGVWRVPLRQSCMTAMGDRCHAKPSVVALFATRP